MSTGPKTEHSRMSYVAFIVDPPLACLTVAGYSRAVCLHDADDVLLQVGLNSDPFLSELTSAYRNGLRSC